VAFPLKTTFAVAICIALGAASSADAATVTVGSPLTANFVATAVGGSGNVTWAQTALPATPASSPSDGTVVSWRNRTLGGTYRLVVIHPAGGGQFTNAGSSDPYHPVNFAASPVITTSLPIRAGDLIGIETTTGNGFDAVGFAGGVSGASGIAWIPHLASGQTRSADPLVTGEIALQATVRFCSVPNLVGTKVGAAKQALAEANCTVGALKKPKKKAARKKAKFVKSQSAAPGTSISDTAPIDLTLGKAHKKHKKHKK
jgi:hypothetical protein